MPEVSIGEVDVSFPFDPYPGQVDYMRKVLQCLHLGWNGALESPTGTGKTLSLLCATLAWLQGQKAEVALRIPQMETEVPVPVTQPGKRGRSKPSCNPRFFIQWSMTGVSLAGLSTPKIFYAARTHSQLSQVVRELNRTAYKGTKMVILGSRDQLCIHEEVSKVPVMGVKNQLCRMKVSKHTCHYYNNYEKATGPDSAGIVMDKDKAPDIEDFVLMGKKKKICPFYASRDGWEEADLILIPYNYILDPRTRRSNKIDLRGSIVIFDEGHNLAKMCEESVSVTLSSRSLASAIRETKVTIAKLEEETEALRTTMDESQVAFGAGGPPGEEDKLGPNIDPNQLLHLLQILQKLEKHLDDVHKGEPEVGEVKVVARLHKGLDGREFDGAFLQRLLDASGLTFAMRDDITNLVDRVGTYLTEKGGVGIGTEVVKGAALETLSSFVSTVYPADDSSLQFSNDCLSAFSVYLGKDDSAEAGRKPGQAFKSSKPAWNLSYWCWEAGLGMELVATKGMRSVLVTSGTLSPIPAFVREMRMYHPDPIKACGRMRLVGARFPGRSSAST